MGNPNRKNMDEALNFYTEVLGLSLVSRRPAGPQVERTVVLKGVINVFENMAWNRAA